MTFEQMLRRAKDGDHEAITSILLMYQPMLLKNAVLDGRLDEDLYQELCITLMRAIKLFRI
ncbi:RNA polymerase subunit sigma [Flavonifractor sp. An92]|uniref:helix-turn-helix domain-containing protein n=1 Tax=Flavonifractor sp. An92 TaxID=1965666 RepID=UPI000B39E143|nr:MULTISPECIES: helix-turn-helix domain-containing protein [unclassified Flavonifractor]OUN07440.1 RNA polymerase subunit sigma [Flavonifractor sp. An92]OUQ23116.1 RNA polymerase subunit sigma [Flavonifractor sp. An135]